MPASVIPSHLDHRAEPAQYPIHCTMHAIELRHLADEQARIVAAMLADGQHEEADLMECRIFQLRRLADLASGGKASGPAALRAADISGVQPRIWRGADDAPLS